ncbi:MAG TPA: hypothetical protein PLO37_20250 [Candidatus Hydrogenedentes bacterium]|nr:hypothetical protein [Candidatus Hydrogenedentota bacterium]HPG69186.1 hypothetical protein [Candidatus Hydrogenedentota bacterium]
MNIGDRFQATVAAVGHGGAGICRHEGEVCFVEQGLPGDAAHIAVVRRAHGVLWGEIAEIITPSPDRATPPCPYFGRCGGCTWLHFAYPAQAKWKQTIVTDCFARIAKIDVAPEWLDAGDLRLGYRTHACFHASPEGLGFYARGSHSVVDIVACPLCHAHLNAALARLRSATPKSDVGVVVNPEGPEALVWSKRPDPALTRLFRTSENTPDATGRDSFLFDGRPIVNGAFSQSSLLLNRLLVSTVERMADAPTRVLDLYCGNGNLSLGFAEHAEVLGIDRTKAAVHAAASLGKGEYRLGDETAFATAIRERDWDVILLDPPRTGAKAITAALADSKARRIVYVSCDPATLARDVKVLAAAGWRPAEVVALDLFPNTPHVETVCRLDR